MFCLLFQCQIVSPMPGSHNQVVWMADEETQIHNVTYWNRNSIKVSCHLSQCRNINVTIWYGCFSAILTFCCLSQFQRQETHPKNKNCYIEVTLYPMDLSWKIFWDKKKLKFSTFYFINLGPALMIFGASWSKTEQLRRTKLFCMCILTTLITI